VTDPRIHNYDINHPTGMANCVEWTKGVLRQLKDGGTWIVPRSGLRVQVIDHDARKCRIIEGFASDLSIKKVLRASGWLIEGDKY